MNVLVNIDVPDLDRAIAFYADGLGLQPARRFGTSGIEMKSGETFIYLLAKTEGSRPFPHAAESRRYDRHWTAVHLDFVATDIENAVTRACNAGARLEAPIESHPWGLIAGLADPFGNGFCILQFSEEGYDAISERSDLIALGAAGSSGRPDSLRPRLSSDRRNRLRCARVAARVVAVTR